MSRMNDILFENWKSDKHLSSSSNSKSNFACFQCDKFDWLSLSSACNNIKKSIYTSEQGTLDFLGLVKVNTAIYCAPTSKSSATLKLVSAVTSIRVLEVQNYTQKSVFTVYRFSNFQTCFLLGFSFLFRIRLDSRPQLLKKRGEIVCFKSWLLFWLLSFGGDRLGGLGKYP